MVCECKGSIFHQTTQANRKENAKKFYPSPQKAQNNALTDCRQNTEFHSQNVIRILTQFSTNQNETTRQKPFHGLIFLTPRRFRSFDASNFQIATSCCPSQRVVSPQTPWRFSTNITVLSAKKQHRNSHFPRSNFPTTLIINPKENAPRFRFLSAYLGVAVKNAISAHCKMTKCK